MVITVRPFFLVETRKTNGENYFAFADVWHLEKFEARVPNFLDNRDTNFSSLKRVMDSPLTFRKHWTCQDYIKQGWKRKKNNKTLDV